MKENKDVVERFENKFKEIRIEGKRKFTIHLQQCTQKLSHRHFIQK